MDTYGLAVGEAREIALPTGDNDGPGDGFVGAFFQTWPWIGSLDSVVAQAESGNRADNSVNMLGMVFSFMRASLEVFLTLHRFCCGVTMPFPE